MNQLTMREHASGPDAVVLGAMNFGTRVDEATSFAVLDRFVELGGTWIDTANCYAFWSDPSGVGGQSEEVIGRWLGARPDMRARVRIATKVRHQPTVPHRWPESAEGLSAPAIHLAIGKSLERLRTDHVDLYWAHGEDLSSPLEETVQAFGELVSAGTVRRLGASNHATWRVDRARRTARQRGLAEWTAVQLRYSYLLPRPGVVLPDEGHVLATPEALDYVAAEPDMMMWAYNPLLNGSYTRADRPLPEIYDHPGTQRRVAALREVADETGATRNQVVLSWLLGGWPRMMPIVGVSAVEHVDEALGAVRIVLTGDQRRRLDAAA